MKMIIARDLNGAIGKDGALPWHCQADLAWFKALTVNKTIIMGRKTFDSLPGLLPRRKHVVISRTMQPKQGVVIEKSPEDAIAKYPDAIIIGGAVLYGQAMPEVTTLYLSLIHTAIDNPDTWFNHFEGDWTCVNHEVHKDCTLLTLERN